MQIGIDKRVKSQVTKVAVKIQTLSELNIYTIVYNKQRPQMFQR